MPPSHNHFKLLSLPLHNVECQSQGVGYVVLKRPNEAGITYGFSVMSSNESPNIPFTVLRMRFEQGNYCHKCMALAATW